MCVCLFMWTSREITQTKRKGKDWIRLVPTCQTVGEICVCVWSCVCGDGVCECMCRGVCVAVVVVWVWEKAGTVSAWTDTDFQVCNKGRTRVGAV